MESKIGMGMRIESVEEFNRRASIALRGVHFHPDNDLDPRLATQLRNNEPLSGTRQTELYRLVHRYRHQITDTLVLNYASDHAWMYA